MLEWNFEAAHQGSHRLSFDCSSGLMVLARAFRKLKDPVRSRQLEGFRQGTA
jgi:hypothetical protein